MAHQVIRVLAFLALSVATSLASTKSVYIVWQPLSLHGTDVDSVVGVESGVDYAVLASRPVVFSGALPEGLVYAVAQSHAMASLCGYAEPEANLMQLFSIKPNAQLSEGVLEVTLDVSKASSLDELEPTLEQAVRLTVSAIRKTLHAYGQAYLESEMKCSIKVVGEMSQQRKLLLEPLNTEFILSPNPEGDD